MIKTFMQRKSGVNRRAYGTTDKALAEHYSDTDTLFHGVVNGDEYFFPLSKYSLTGLLHKKENNQIFSLIDNINTMGVYFDGYTDTRSVQNVNTYGTHSEYGVYIDFINIEFCNKLYEQGLYSNKSIKIIIGECSTSGILLSVVKKFTFTIPKNVSRVDVKKFFGVDSGFSGRKYYSIFIGWNYQDDYECESACSYWFTYDRFYKKYDVYGTLDHTPIYYEEYGLDYGY